MQAVRAAIGQLITYRHFLYPAAAAVLSIAAFTQDVGNAFVELLESLGIAVVSLDASGNWVASPLAADVGFAA